MDCLFSQYGAHIFLGILRELNQIKKIFLLSPAGKILFVGKSKSLDNLSDNQSKEMQKISIFMNVFDVHINRIPISGKFLVKICTRYFSLNASLDKSSEDNERMIIKIEYSKNKHVYVVQIAGLIARRIKCISENQSVEIGRFGLIRFGSRVDLYFPNDFDPLVSEGQTYFRRNNLWITNL